MKKFITTITMMTAMAVTAMAAYDNYYGGSSGGNRGYDRGGSMMQQDQRGMQGQHMQGQGQNMQHMQMQGQRGMQMQGRGMQGRGGQNMQGQQGQQGQQQMKQPTEAEMKEMQEKYHAGLRKFANDDHNRVMNMAFEEFKAGEKGKEDPRMLVHAALANNQDVHGIMKHHVGNFCGMRSKDGSAFATFIYRVYLEIKMQQEGRKMDQNDPVFKENYDVCSNMNRI